MEQQRLNCNKYSSEVLNLSVHLVSYKDLFSEFLILIKMAASQ